MKKSSAKEILQKLIEFDTADDRENSLITEWLSSFLARLGFKVKFINGTKGRRSTLASIGKKQIITFCSHTDTVPAVGKWTVKPYQLTEKKGRYYGLGACDLKGGLAASLFAASQIDWKKAKSGINFFFTYDEEKELEGMKNFVKHYKLSSRYTIITEPTDALPIACSKGIVEFRAEFTGIAHHSSEPEKGKNAIILAQDFTAALLKKFAEIKKQKNHLFNPPVSSINIAKIQGGDAINRVPAKCVIDFECRLISLSQVKKIDRLVKALAKKFNGIAEMGLLIPPMASAPGKLAQAIEKITGDKIRGANYTTEGSLLPDQEILVLGPGPVMPHQTDEYITIASYEKTISAFSQLMEKFCF